ncbi:protein pleiotropic regulatory locus 1-like [Prunus yedoensis var. nudiflora]|uniref:Protein pleiotropic regulatory locus 1-like n=1 Tax=Prunus yedoensis var. nudiflora TaxID=2094558 RepID=A0A314XSC9_PRUYE|nr:protein pleiotropic regulatory locus 1-like [Prunus yedoensis var. nudiflora]
MSTLTHHKKSVRAMAQHPKDINSFASVSADNVKKFNLPNGEFLHNMMSQQKTIVNAMAVNRDGVMATGAAVFALSYDVTGTRLVTCGADKTIKMWKKDQNATPETHPLNFKPPKDIRRF